MPSNPEHPTPAPLPSRGLLLALLQPKVAIALAVLAALVTLPLAYRGSRIAGLPDPGDPFDVEKEGTITLAPGENAFDDYAAAAPLLTPYGDLDLDAEAGKSWAEVSEPVRLWVEANRPALDRFRAGSEKPDALYVQPRDLRIDTQLPLINDLQTFARLARLEAWRLEQEGNPDAAWTIHRALFRASRHAGRDGCMIARVVGIAMHSVAATGMERWSRDPRVTPAMVEEALRAIQTDERLAAPPSKILKSEYILMHAVFQSHNIAEDLDIESDGDSAALLKAKFFVENEPEFGRRVTRQAFANWLEHIDKPRHEQPPHRGKLNLFDTGTSPGPGRLAAEDIERFFDRSIVARQLLPFISQFRSLAQREGAKQATLVVALASQLYRRRTGAFPGTPTELVDSGILAEIPRDPFSASGDRLLYRTAGEKAVIWSIGENGSDDDGDITADPSGRSEDIGFEIGAQSDEARGKEGDQ
jgi:hypothetical protein